MRIPAWKERLWPHLFSEGYTKTSEETWRYNCIAFAADDESQWWWPDAEGNAFWPPGVARKVEISCFIQAYRTLGYEVCEEGLESGYERIVIYALNGEPTHAAKQLENGRWKSKLGRFEDIEHNTLKAVTEYIYGEPAVFMRRKANAPQV